MKLVLHIGPHKTGSSTIQFSMKKGVDDLARQGVLFFKTEPLATWALVAKYATPKQRAHPAIRAKFKTDEDVLQWSEEIWADLDKAIQTSNAQVCVLSSEHFAALPEKKVARLMVDLKSKFSDISVVAYARDPASLYLSTLQQHIQGGRRLRVLTTPERFHYTLRNQLTRFADHVGWSNVIVRNFDRNNLVENDVARDFLSVLCAHGVQADVPSISLNEALPGAAIAWLLTANETWDRVTLGENRSAVLTKLRNSKRIADLPRLRFETEEFQDAIRSAAGDDLRWINQNCLKGQIPLKDSAIEFKMTQGGGHEQLRNWLMGYLTQESMQILAQEILATE